LNNFGTLLIARVDLPRVAIWPFSTGILSRLNVCSWGYCSLIHSSGYSRLIRADEEGTIAALKALRADLIDPKIAEHHGRVVKLMGDGMLAEFASVVDAVRAAAETQRAVAERNADLPEYERIEFRVGINLGDVVIDGDDIHGDGVNVAARLESLAETGGICISGSVHEQVRDRLDLPFEDLGEQRVKNIDRPVRVWQQLLIHLQGGR